jgi:hypothetical protein
LQSRLPFRGSDYSLCARSRKELAAGMRKGGYPFE